MRYTVRMRGSPPPLEPEPPPTPAPERLEAPEVRRRALSGLVAIALRSVTIRVMGLAANVVLARALAPRDFGLMAFGLGIVSIGGFLANGGLGAALIRQEHPPEREQLEAVLGVQLLATSVAVAVIAAIGLPFGAAGAVATIMALSLPLDTIRVPAALVTERTLTYRPIVRAEVGEMLVYNVVAVTTVLLGAGIWGVAAAVVCRALAGTVVLIRLAGTGFVRPRLSWSLVRPLYRFALTLQGVNLVNLARDQGLNLGTAAIGGTAVLGFASFAQRLVQPIWLIFDASWRVSYPAMSRLLETGEDPQPTLERTLRLAATATGLGVVAVGAAAPALVPSVFGEKWHEAIPVVPFALMGLMLGGPVSACGAGYFSAQGRAHRILQSATLVAVAGLGLGLPLVPAIGATAVGIGWFVGGLVDVLFLGEALRRAAGVRVIRAMALPVMTAVVVGAGGWLLAERLGPTLLSTFVTASVAGLAYLAVLVLFQRAAVLDVVDVLRRLVPRRASAAV